MCAPLIYGRFPLGNARNIAVWVGLVLLILALFNLFIGTGGTLQSREITYSDFVSAVEDGEVTQATLDGEQIRFRGADNQDYVTIKPEDAVVTDLLIQNNIPIRAEKQQQSLFQSILSYDFNPQLFELHDVDFCLIRLLTES